MFFNSLEFAVFLPVVFILYWFFTNKNLKLQNLLIVAASYFFYGWWDWRFLSLIIFSTLVDYSIGVALQNQKDEFKRKILLWVSIGVNLGFLGVFKYYNWFLDSLYDAIPGLHVASGFNTLDILLPVGISFYTFQTLSYTIDVYKRQIEPTTDLIAFSAFVSFFPQLVAGPIERAKNLLPQFQKTRKFIFENARMGTTLIIYGLFKKVVVADRLAIYVNSVFGDIQNANTISLTLAIIFFSFQIYCDFSGYSLMARGTAKLFGFDLMVNFNKPYLASTIPDFWRRWHISLSTWFRDYLYIPLGGNRRTEFRNSLNLLMIFLISGLWHGANWTFIFWGALHGIFQIFYVYYFKLMKGMKMQKYFSLSSFPKLSRILGILLVFILVNFAWIFFRAETIGDAFLFVQKLMELNVSYNLVQLSAEKGPLNLLLSFFVIGLLLLSYLLPKDFVFKKSSSYLVVNVLTIFVIILIGINGKQEFIYFQF